MIYKEKILETIVKDFFDTNIIKDGDIILIALSGGMDSICLFDVFYKLQSEVNYKMMAIHINHGIRENEASRDEAFVKDYCTKFNTELIVKKVDSISFAKENNMTLEEAARKLRYEAFENEWKKLSIRNVNNDVYIVVAHHQKDQVETIVHNIIRGTGIKGLVGMKKVNGSILRPLLSIKKEEIEKYISENNIPYVIDSTNEDTEYTRNYIRKEIIDKFKNINAKAYDHIIELSNMSLEINDFLEKESNRILKSIIIEQNDKKIIIDLKQFRLKEKVLKKEIIRKILNNLVNTLKDITKMNIDDIIELSEKESGGHLDLPYNVTIDKKHNELTFIKNDINISMSRRKKK